MAAVAADLAEAEASAVDQEAEDVDSAVDTTADIIIITITDQEAFTDFLALAIITAEWVVAALEFCLHR